MDSSGPEGSLVYSDPRCHPMLYPSMPPLQAQEGAVYASLLMGPLSSLLPHSIPFRFQSQTEPRPHTLLFILTQDPDRICPSMLAHQAQAQEGAAGAHSLAASDPDPQTPAATQAHEQLGTSSCGFL